MSEASQINTSSLSLSFLPQSASCLRLRARWWTLPSIFFLLVCFCAHIPLFCLVRLPSSSHLCPLYIVHFLQETFGLSTRVSPPELAPWREQVFFDSCRLFDSLMCRRSRAQPESRLTVVFHSCMCASATQQHNYFTNNHHPILTELGWLSEHMLHLQTLKTPVSSPCPLSLPSSISLYTGAFASVFKCFISSPPSVHHTLPPFSPVCIDLFTYFTLPLTQSLLPRATDEESGCEWIFHAPRLGMERWKYQWPSQRHRQLLCPYMFVCENENGSDRENEGSISVRLWLKP